MDVTTGGCLCGAVRYEARGRPKFALSCHCRDCQYVSGGGPAHVLLFAAEAVTVTKGQPRTYRSKSESGNDIGRSFCEACGTPLFAHNAAHPEVLPVKVGSLDDPSTFRPRADIWVSSAQPWTRLDSTVPQVAKNPSVGVTALALGKASLAKLGRKIGLT